QAPLTVLLQQGGQLKDMFGGIGPAARAVGGYIAGLVNPYTIAAAAAGVLALAFYQGSVESSRLTNALVKNGNAAGTTAGQLSVFAQQVGAGNATVAQAASA
ncbi:phage tail length tape measure family protein, partial [Pseudomonas aeruginosa]